MPGGEQRVGTRLHAESHRVATTDYLAPSTAPFMINYRVDDLMALLDVLRSEGCNVVDKTDDSEFGKFGWVIDPEGNKVELWQPPASS